MSDFWTSDTHFGHKNILRYCNRPWASIEEHDEALIENYNAVVKKGDRVFHLGDIAMGSQRTVKIMRRLNGQITLLRGNHDPERVIRELLNSRVISAAHDLLDLKVAGQNIVMCHFPLLTWHRAHYGSWMLHGHSHNGLPPTEQRRIDVGVDAWNYRPVSFEELHEVMQERTYTPVDHHR